MFQALITAVLIYAIFSALGWWKGSKKKESTSLSASLEPDFLTKVTVWVVMACVAIGLVKLMFFIVLVAKTLK